MLALPSVAEIHNWTKNFIDIEVPASDILVYCFQMDLEEKRSLMVFDVLDERRIFHEFVYRRLQDTEICKKTEAEYGKFLRNANTVQVVGIQPNPPKMRKENELPANAPPKFRKLMEKISWNFVRMQTKNGCKAYFEEDCILPKNYWAGISPE